MYFLSTVLLENLHTKNLGVTLDTDLNFQKDREYYTVYLQHRLLSLITAMYLK